MWIQGLGVYAGSHDSYSAFSSLFDNIIKEYHGHGKEDKHMSDMDSSKVNCPPLFRRGFCTDSEHEDQSGQELGGVPLGTCFEQGTEEGGGTESDRGSRIVRRGSEGTVLCAGLTHRGTEGTTHCRSFLVQGRRQIFGSLWVEPRLA